MTACHLSSMVDILSMNADGYLCVSVLRVHIENPLKMVGSSRILGCVRRLGIIGRMNVLFLSDPVLLMTLL